MLYEKVLSIFTELMVLQNDEKYLRKEQRHAVSNLFIFQFNHYRLLWIKINARICKFNNITGVSPVNCSTDVSVNCSTPNTEIP